MLDDYKGIPFRFLSEHKLLFCGGKRLTCYGCGSAVAMKEIAKHVHEECPVLTGFQLGLSSSPGQHISSHGHATSPSAIPASDLSTVNAVELSKSEVALHATSANTDNIPHVDDRLAMSRKPDAVSSGQHHPSHPSEHQSTAWNTDAVAVPASPPQRSGLLPSVLSPVSPLSPQEPHTNFANVKAATDSERMVSRSTSTPLVVSASTGSKAPVKLTTEDENDSDQEDDAPVQSVQVKTSPLTAEDRVRKAPVISLQFDAPDSPATSTSTPDASNGKWGVHGSLQARPGKSSYQSSVVVGSRAITGKALSNPHSAAQPAKTFHFDPSSPIHATSPPTADSVSTLRSRSMGEGGYDSMPSPQYSPEVNGGYGYGLGYGSGPSASMQPEPSFVIGHTDSTITSPSVLQLDVRSPASFHREASAKAGSQSSGHHHEERGESDIIDSLKDMSLASMSPPKRPQRGEKLPHLEPIIRDPTGSRLVAEGDKVRRTGLQGVGEIVGANRQFQVTMIPGTK